MVEAHQIICIILCSSITLPALPAVVISQYFQIANFNLVNVGAVYKKIFTMPTIDPVNQNFNALGFGDTYFINNAGSILLMIIGLILA